VRGAFGVTGDLAVAILVHIHHEIVDVVVTMDEGVVQEISILFRKCAQLSV